MNEIQLAYGRSSIRFEFDEKRFAILDPTQTKVALTDRDINSRLDNPIVSNGIEDICRSGESVLIVVPDATREVGCSQILNVLIRRLIECGIEPFRIRIIFATGIHRKVSEQEKIELLTPFINQRIKSIDHSPRDIVQLIRLGETSTGIPVELNRALVEHDRVIVIGGISFHYFAGFTGGRKLICPGLASATTISQTHKLAFDCQTRERREGVESGLLRGNAVNDAFVEAAKFAPPDFAISSIVDRDGNILELFCGDWIHAHESACSAFAEANTVEIPSKRDFAIVSCGGFPFDIDLIQAHKSLDIASKAVHDGGTIYLIAECSDGFGGRDFIRWFDHGKSDQLAEKLCESYSVNGQTAWSLLKKTEKFDVKMITQIENAEISNAGIERVAKIDVRDDASTGYIIPFAAKCRIISSLN